MRLTREEVVGTQEYLSLTPTSVFNELQPGNLVGLDFDGVVLLVLAIDSDSVETVVLNGGKDWFQQGSRDHAVARLASAFRQGSRGRGDRQKV